ncbi:MAG: serine/threonine protein phosphatase, partial [Clostridia bacterium]|nr:serine/threonine protein phosphatase [Clostridia bacterium]
TISAVRRILPKNIYAIQNDALKFGDYIFCGTRGWTVSETGVFETEHDHKIFNSEVVRLELTLSAAKKLQKNNEKIICMIHFPPMNSKKEPSEFTNLIEKYDVSKVVYGHLHKNKKSFSSPLYYIQNGVEYYLTSCDMLNFELVSIV